MKRKDDQLVGSLKEILNLTLSIRKNALKTILSYKKIATKSVFNCKINICVNRNSNWRFVWLHSDDATVILCTYCTQSFGIQTQQPLFAHFCEAAFGNLETSERIVCINYTYTPMWHT